MREALFLSIFGLLLLFGCAAPPEAPPEEPTEEIVAPPPEVPPEAPPEEPPEVPPEELSRAGAGMILEGRRPVPGDGIRAHATP